MHAVWRAAGKTNGVCYICGDEDGRERIKKAAKTGRTYTADALGLTVELLDTIKAPAIEMRDADPRAVGFRRPARCFRPRRIRPGLESSITTVLSRPT